MPLENTKDALPVFILGNAIMTPDVVQKLTDGPGAPLQLPMAEFQRLQSLEFGRKAPLLHSGGAWLNFHDGEVTYLNKDKLWKPGVTRMPFTDQGSARTRADALLGNHQLLSITADPDVDFAFERIAGTRVAIFDAVTGLRLPSTDNKPYFEIDQQVCYALHVKAIDPDTGTAIRLPVLGRGTTGRVIVGPGGEVFGLYYGIRLVAGRLDSLRVIPAEESFAVYRQLLGHREIRNPRTYLAYKRVDDDGGALWPVWVHRADARLENDWSALKEVALTAVKGLGVPETVSGPPSDDPPLEDVGPGPGVLAAAYWMTGVARSSDLNATRFLSELQGKGLRVAMARGGRDAVVTDWNSVPDQPVDNVNIVFYSGHADQRRILLRDPVSGGDRYFLKTTPVTFGNQGAQSLDWVVISACGPMQDRALPADAINGAPDVFGWRGLFKGLHMLLGHGTEVGDSPEEGELFAQLCLAGHSVAEAWFITSIQLAGGRLQTWPGILYPRMANDEGTLQNRLWGFAPAGTPIVEPPQSPEQFVAVWVPA